MSKLWDGYGLADLLDPILVRINVQFKNKKTNYNKRTGPRTTYKLINSQAEAHETLISRITPKKGEVVTSSNGAKVNIGTLQGLQPTNTTA